MFTPLQDWDDAFSNMAHIPGSDRLPQVWADRAAAYRAGGVRIETDIPYGDQARERFDLVWPDGPPAGLVMFVHGGYWMQLDKSYWSDLAEGARAAGWAVCLPSYTLAPEARIAQMGEQIAAALTAAAARVPGPIRITGHSAGGHLATRMICDDTGLDAATLDRIASALSISGVHDLRPLMQTRMNKTLQLDAQEAADESPVLHRPARQIPYCAWVGGAERPEFIRQSRLMAGIWRSLDMPAHCVVQDRQDHFSVIDGLRDPDSEITRALLG